jgi:hypothetical protein
VTQRASATELLRIPSKHSLPTYTFAPTRWATSRVSSPLQAMRRSSFKWSSPQSAIGFDLGSTVFRCAILTPHCLTKNVTEQSPLVTGVATPNRAGVVDGGKGQQRARREVVSAVAKRYQSAERSAKGGYSRRAVRDHGLASQARAARTSATRDCLRRRRRSTARAQRRYGATIKDALTALWEASDRVSANGSR